MAVVPLGLAILVALAGACGGESGARGASGGVSGAPDASEASSGGSGNFHNGLGGAPNPAGSGSGSAASGRSSGESAGDGGAAGSSGSGAEAGRGYLAGGGSGGHVEMAGHVEMPPPIELTAGAAGSGGEPAGVCDSDALWAAITSQVIGACYPASPMLGPDEHLSPRRGTVILDAQGRVIDNTGLSSLTKQQWLEKLSAKRWPCLAGQTIGYQCTVAG